MALFEVFIPGREAGTPNVTLTMEAPNWIGALRSGLKSIGEGQEAIANVMCDIKEDNSIHVTDVATRRVFRLREVKPEVKLEAKKPEQAMHDTGPRPISLPDAPAIDDTIADETIKNERPPAMSAAATMTAPKTLLEFQAPKFDPPPAKAAPAPVPAPLLVAKPGADVDASIPWTRMPAPDLAAAAPTSKIPDPRKLVSPASAGGMAPAPVTAAAVPAPAPIARGTVTAADLDTTSKLGDMPDTLVEAPAVPPPPAAKPTPIAPVAPVAAKPAPAAASAPTPQKTPQATSRPPAGPPTPRGVPAPAPKRPSGQFSAAPEPRSREVTRPNPTTDPRIGRPDTQKPALDVQEAIAAVFDATQDLYMEEALSPQKVADKLLDIALAHIPAESGTFYLADVNGHELTFAAVRGPRADALKRSGMTVKVGQGIIGFCAQEGVCLAVSDIQKDPRFLAAIAKSIDYQPKDTLCASAEKDGRLYGAVQMINSKSGFDAAHMEVLRFIGLTAAAMLERALDRS